MPDLTFEVEYLKDIPQGVLLVLGGAIDAKTVPSFQENLNKLKESGITRFVLDMEQIKYVNSTGLGYLVNLADSVELQGGGIALVKIHPKVKVVFDMLGLNAFFKIHNNRKDALEHFRSTAGGAGGSSKPTAEDDIPVAEPLPVAPPPPPPRQAPAQPRPAPAPVAAAIARPSGPQPPRGGEQPVTGPTPAVEPVPEGQTITCSSCRQMLVVPEAGTFRCPRCAAMFTYLRDGKANFWPKRKPALTLTLSCVPECTEALCSLVQGLSRRGGATDQALKEIDRSIRETVGTIIETAYGKQEIATYQVMVVATETELNLKFSDYGKALSAESLFGETRRSMDVFDHKPHPKGGNVVTLSKKLHP